MNIFDFAQSVEQSGQKFYEEMKRTCQDKGLRNVFGMLAGDQERMLEKLAELRSRYADIEVVNCASLNPRSNVFATLLKNRENLEIEGDLQAYQLAIEVERRIFALYERAIAKETDPTTRNLLRRIAALERREMRDIEQVFDFVNAPNEFLEWGEFSNLDEFHNFGRYVDGSGPQ